MKGSPAFLFYVDRFIGGTLGMTLAQRGAYITLLCLQFSKGFLEIDEIENLLGRDFEAVWPKISKKFDEIEPGIFQNSFMNETREERLRLSKTRAENGSKGGRPKAKEKLNETSSFVFGDSNRDNTTMDDTVETKLVVRDKDDTMLSLSRKSENQDPNLIEREFKILFVEHFDQKGNLNPTRAAYVDVVLKLEADGMSRAEACACINEQGRRWRLCANLEGKTRRHYLNCENWLEHGEWQKDYEAMAESIEKNKAAASASPVQAQLNILSGGKKL